MIRKFTPGELVEMYRVESQVPSRMNNPTPDYRDILIKLISKVQRSGNYYRGLAKKMRRNAVETNIPAKRVSLEGRALTLEKCAADCDYSYLRATAFLLPDDIEGVRMEVEASDRRSPRED